MSTPDPLDQLKRLAELRDQGIVSAEEFEATKAQLLASVGQTPPVAQDETQPADAAPCAASAAPAAASPATEKAEPTPLEQLSDAELIGRVRPADVARAQQQWRSLHESSRQVAKARTRLRLGRALARLRLRYNGFVQASRKMFDKGLMGRPGARAVLLAAIIGLFLLVTIFCTLNPWVLIASGLLGALLGYLWLRNLLFYPPDTAVVAMEARLRQNVADFVEPMQRSQEESEKLASQRREARRTLDRFQTAIRSRKRRLLATDWRALRGDAFESFLVEVFDDLGYSMESTKSSGGQGADLILTRDGVKTAVQARGCEGSVGNSAVQEVFLGMTFFGCQRCCVVTNSTFTAVAKKLAANRGCQLIDGSQIPDLIRGKITV